MADMSDGRISLNIVKVVNPCKFLAKESSSVHMSPEARDFHNLSARINSHYDDDQALAQNQDFSPSVNKICIGRCSKDRKWYRVQVINLLQRRYGPTASCRLVDVGGVELIQFVWLREAPPVFLRVPFQVKEYALANLQPVTLRSSEDLTIRKEPCDRWDASAVRFTERMIQDSQGAKAEKIHIGRRGVIHVRLYLTTDNGTIYCLNDALVKGDYAVFNESVDMNDQSSDSGHSENDVQLSSVSIRTRHTIDNSTDLAQAPDAYSEITSLTNTSHGRIASNINNRRSIESVAKKAEHLTRGGSVLGSRTIVYNYSKIEEEMLSMTDEDPTYSDRDEIHTVSQEITTATVDLHDMCQILNQSDSVFNRGRRKSDTVLDGFDISQSSASNPSIQSDSEVTIGKGVRPKNPVFSTVNSLPLNLVPEGELRTNQKVPKKKNHPAPAQILAEVQNLNRGRAKYSSSDETQGKEHSMEKTISRSKSSTRSDTNNCDKVDEKTSIDSTIKSLLDLKNSVCSDMPSIQMPFKPDVTVLAVTKCQPETVPESLVDSHSQILSSQSVKPHTSSMEPNQPHLSSAQTLAPSTQSPPQYASGMMARLACAISKMSNAQSTPPNIMTSPPLCNGNAESRTEPYKSTDLSKYRLSPKPADVHAGNPTCNVLDTDNNITNLNLRPCTNVTELSQSSELPASSTCSSTMSSEYPPSYTSMAGLATAGRGNAISLLLGGGGNNFTAPPEIGKQQGSVKKTMMQRLLESTKPKTTVNDSQSSGGEPANQLLIDSQILSPQNEAGHRALCSDSEVCANPMAKLINSLRQKRDHPNTQVTMTGSLAQNTEATPPNAQPNLQPQTSDIGALKLETLLDRLVRAASPTKTNCENKSDVVSSIASSQAKQNLTKRLCGVNDNVTHRLPIPDSRGDHLILSRIKEGSRNNSQRKKADLSPYLISPVKIGIMEQVTRNDYPLLVRSPEPDEHEQGDCSLDKGDHCDSADEAHSDLNLRLPELRPLVSDCAGQEPEVFIQQDGDGVKRQMSSVISPPGSRVWTERPAMSSVTFSDEDNIRMISTSDGCLGSGTPLSLKAPSKSILKKSPMSSSSSSSSSTSSVHGCSSPRINGLEQQLDVFDQQISVNGHVSEDNQRGKEQSPGEIGRAIMSNSPFDMFDEALSDPATFLRRQRTLQHNRSRGDRLFKELTFRSSHQAMTSHMLALEEKERLGGWSLSERPNDKVFVYGLQIKKPLQRFDEIPVDPRILEALDAKGYVAPRLMQAYSWPVIRRGRHMVGISPHKTGKILAYLVPLVAELTQTAKYSDVPRGTSPLVIIVCASWKKAQAVYDECRSMTNSIHTLFVKVIYGGASQENQCLDVINGCDVLIATLPSLLRMLTGNQTTLTRLCHLVLDSADSLIEDFREEIDKLMQIYGETLRARKNNSIPRQLLVFGTKWTDGVEALCQTFMLHVVIVITSRFEAAIYGGVEQIVHLCSSKQVLTTILGLVASVSSKGNQKIIIFATDTKDVCVLDQSLKTNCYYSLMIHSDMDSHQITGVLREWAMPHESDSRPVLVCSDDCSFELQLTDATAVIHYNIPDSQTKFGNRLATMADHYNKISDSAQESVYSPVSAISHLVISEKTGKVAKALIRLLRRTKCTVPLELKQLVEGMMEGAEEARKYTGLCTYLKAYGVCKKNEIEECEPRHMIRPELDTPGHASLYKTLPDCGSVTVLVCSIADASCLFVRLLEHHSYDGTKTDHKMEYSKLLFDITHWFATPEHKIPIVLPEENLVCAILDRTGVYHRVQVVDVNPTRQRNTLAKRVHVYYVDQGKKEECLSDRLYRIPEELKDVPFQAIEVYISRVKPVDKDIEWTKKATVFMYDTVNGKELRGKIVLSLGNTLWLDPVVQLARLDSIGVTINKINLRTVLLNNGFATDNPEHITKLHAACAGKIALSKWLTSKAVSSLCKLPDTETLPSDDCEIRVFVSAVHSPESCYVQLEDKHKHLEWLMDKLNSDMTDQSALIENITVQAGMFCVAIPSVDERWHRGEILSHAKDGKFDVFFVDYGEVESVAREKIHSVSEELLHQLPFQAIECALAYISPIGDDWEPGDKDALNDMCLYYNGDKKSMTIKVLDETRATFGTAQCCYIVTMHDQNDSNIEVNVAEELVWGQHATCDDSGYIKPLFAQDDEDNVDENGYEQIFTMCSDIYSCENAEDAAQKTHDMQKVVHDVLTIHASDVSQILPKVVTVLWKLARYSCHERVFELLMMFIGVASINYERTLTDLMHVGLVPGLCTLLFNLQSEGAQEKCVKAIDALVQVLLGQQAFTDPQYMEALVEKLRITRNETVAEFLLSSLATICDNSDSRLEVLFEADGIRVLCDLVAMEQESSVAANIFRLLDVITKSESHYAKVQREPLLAFATQTLSTADNKQACECAVSFLYHLSQKGGKYMRFLLEGGVVIAVNKLLASMVDLCTLTRQQCAQLLQCLSVSFCADKVIRGVAPVCNGISDDVCLPTGVRWCQRAWVLNLSVKLFDVRNENMTVNYTEDSIQFKAVVDGQRYEFNFQFFGRIDCNRCREKLRHSEVIISLRKRVKGFWPFLLKDKEKPGYLSVDHERFRGSTSSDSNGDQDDENIVFIKPVAKKRQLPKVRKADLPKPRDLTTMRYSSSESEDSMEGYECRERDRYDVFDAGF